MGEGPDQFDVASNRYLACDGIPVDIEQDAQNSEKAFESMVRRPAPAARAPFKPGFKGRAVHIPDIHSPDPVEVVRAKGIPAVGEGVKL
jgi:hypothetical protein